MGADEEGTLAQFKAHRLALVDPKISEYRGRIVKTTGDGMLAEFASVVDAARCAVELQRGMMERNAAVPQNQRIEFRIGINVGDIIIDGDDIHGDGVNIAARLEGIAEPGGICMSRQAHEQVEGKIPVGFRRLGAQNLKNIAKPVEVFAVRIDAAGAPESVPKSVARSLKQEIKYCRSHDGVRLAYAIAGNGPPLVKTANWLNHLEYDWECPIFRPIFESLVEKFTLIRYDARGNGLSDWQVDTVSLDAWVGDLEAVVDAAGLDRFPLLGFSQGAAMSIAYAVRHPERVSHLLLYGGFARGRHARSTSDAERDKVAAMQTLMKAGWGEENPMFRQMFTHQIIPGATTEQHAAFNELQRKTTSPECAARYFDAVGRIDITELLPKVSTPTLIIHARDDLAAPLDEGRRLAAGIRGSKFVVLQGQNHIPLEQDLTWPRIVEEVDLFLKETAQQIPACVVPAPSA